MLWFVVLAGVTHQSPLNKIWFLRADTSGIGNARPVSQWTFWHVCGENNENCGNPVPALPLGYAWRENSRGAPRDLTGNHGHGTTARYYYYMWRFGWVFYLFSFVFANLAAVTGVLSCIRIIAGATGLLTLAATFWMTLSACLMTAVFVKARNRFNDEGRDARVGPYAFGFTWASLCLLFMASCLFLGGAFIGRKRDKHIGYGKENAYGNGNTGYPPGNQGFASDNIQSGYAGNQRANVIHDDAPARGDTGRRGLFPRHREASVV